MSAADNTAQARERSSSTSDGSRREWLGYAVNCWLGQYDYTKTPPTYHMKVPSHCVIAIFQLYGSLMLESPDCFFRVREIGRLSQTIQYLGLCVCLSVKSHLTYEVSVYPENAVTYSARNEDQKICGDLPETTAFKSYATKHERKSQLLIIQTYPRSAFTV